MRKPGSHSGALFAVSLLLTALSGGVFELIFNLYLVKLGFREDFIGQVIFLSTLGMAAGALPLGYLGRRVPQKQALVAGAAVAGLALTGQSLITYPPAIMALGLAAGGGQALFSVMMVPFLAEISPLSRRKQTFAYNYAAYAVAVLVGYILGGQLPGLLIPHLSGPSAELLAYRATLLVGAGTMLLGTLPLLWLPARTSSNGGSPAEGEEKAAPFHRSPNACLIMLALVGTILSFAGGLFSSFVNVYLATQLGASAAQVGLFYQAGSISAITAILISPWVAGRLGTVNTLGLARMAAGPMVLGIGLAPHLGLAALAHVGRVFALHVAWPLDGAFLTEVIPPELRTRASSARTMAVGLPFAAAGLVGGWLIVRVGYLPLFVAGATLTFFAGAVFLAFFREWGRTTLEEGRRKMEDGTMGS